MNKQQNTNRGQGRWEGWGWWKFGLLLVLKQILEKHQVFSSIPLTIFIMQILLQDLQMVHIILEGQVPQTAYNTAAEVVSEPTEHKFTKDTFIYACLYEACFYCRNMALLIHYQLVTHYHGSPAENYLSILADEK